MNPDGPRYRGVLARVALQQIREHQAAAEILGRIPAEVLRAVEDASTLEWLSADLYHEVMEAVALTLSPAEFDAFWRNWVPRFIKTPLARTVLSQTLAVAGLGPAFLINLVPRVRQLASRDAGELRLDVSGELREATLNYSKIPIVLWRSGTQPRAVAATMGGVFDLSGVPGTVSIDDSGLSDGVCRFALRW